VLSRVGWYIVAVHGQELIGVSITLANDTGVGGGGGKTDHGYEELYFTKESNLKEGKIGPIECKFFTFCFLSVCYLPLLKSVTK
jgi:hypothetical protein